MSKHSAENDKEPKIDAMWSADEDERRLAITAEPPPVRERHCAIRPPWPPSQIRG
jgi:hypothetical protein